MFGWLWRRSSAGFEQLAVNYERIRQSFGQRFPTGGFSSCDFRPHFAGHGHNAWSEIMPTETVEETCALGYARLVEMVDFLRPLQPLFGPHDRIQFAVGFPITVKAVNRRMFKGWFPVARLEQVKPPDFASVGGAIGENGSWFEGLWPGVVWQEAEPGAAPDTAI
ncbi:MAG TPA: hypothetical protein VGE74_15830 [Gemmata sp.]